MGPRLGSFSPGCLALRLNRHPQEPPVAPVTRTRSATRYPSTQTISPAGWPGRRRARWSAATPASARASVTDLCPTRPRGGPLPGRRRAHDACGPGRSASTTAVQRLSGHAPGRPFDPRLQADPVAPGRAGRRRARARPRRRVPRPGGGGRRPAPPGRPRAGRRPDPGRSTTPMDVQHVAGGGGGRAQPPPERAAGERFGQPGQARGSGGSPTVASDSSARSSSRSTRPGAAPPAGRGGQ